MAMNKKEQAEVAALRLQLAEAKALHFTEPVEPDLQPPTDHGVTLLGYAAYNAKGPVEAVWTSSHTHGFRHGEKKRTCSSDGRALYSLRSMCLRSVRAYVEREAAAALHKLDVAIAEAEAEEAKS